MLAVENMKSMPIDPIRGLIGVNLYYQEAVRARNYLTKLKTKVGTDKIVFNENDAGVFFNQYFAKIK